MSKRVLDINDLNVGFLLRRDHKIVTDVKLSHRQGRTVGIVRGVRHGKSMTALSIVRLIKCPPGYAKGEIRLNGRTCWSCRARCTAMSGKTSMIFPGTHDQPESCVTVGNS